jgi:hypothetical protein
MPFKSQAQRRWMYANHPEMAEEWSEHTPKGAKLPERVKHKKAENAIDPALEQALNRYLEQKKNINDPYHPNYGRVLDPKKEVLKKKILEKIKKDSDESMKFDSTIPASIGSLYGGGLGLAAGTIASPKSKLTTLILGLLGAAGGGYAGHKISKNRKEQYNKINDSEKDEQIAEYVNKSKDQPNQYFDNKRARLFSGIAGVASIPASLLAQKVFSLGADKLDKLEDRHLDEIIENAKLKNKLDIEKPTPESKVDNAYFKGYNGKPGKVGLVKALSERVYKPGVMAHEIGHANIHASPGIVGKIQRNLYGPTQKFNMLGGGILAPRLAYKLVGKDDDSMLSGAAKGALLGTAANAGVLIPEFEASRRGIKYMMNSSMPRRKVLGNALSILPAFLSYGTTLAAPSAITGALKAYINKKRIEHDEKINK